MSCFLSMSHLVLHLVVKCQVPLHLCPKGGSVSTERTNHVAPLPFLTVLDVVPQRGSSLVHPVTERTGLLTPPCIWSTHIQREVTFLKRNCGNDHCIHYMYPSIYTFSKLLIPFRDIEVKPIPACIGKDTGHILHRLPAYHTS